MKIPELYLHEVIATIRMLEEYADRIVVRTKKIQRRARLRRFFWPLGFRDYMFARTAELNVMLVEMKSAKNLHQKLLMATGIDDDGKQFTVKDVIEKITAAQQQ